MDPAFFGTSREVDVWLSGLGMYAVVLDDTELQAVGDTTG
jgi:hypothetical protein